jgi:hypothetical protein
MGAWDVVGSAREGFDVLAGGVSDLIGGATEMLTGPAHQVDPTAFKMDPERERALLKGIGAGQQLGAERERGAFGQQQEARGQIQDVAAMLRARAMGEAPSAAELQMQEALRRQQASAQAMAAGAGGVSPALAQRLAQRQMTQAGLETSAQAAALRAQEQAGAEQALAGVLGGVRAQDIQLQQMGQERMQAYLQMGMDLAEAERRARVDIEAARAEAAAGSQQARASMLGGLAAGAGAFFGSDERIKTKTHRAGKDIDKFLKALEAHGFEYKSEKHGKGKHFGIMAQDALKSRIGKSLVVDSPEGLMLDTKKTFMAMLASQARLDERLRRVEGQ